MRLLLLTSIAYATGQTEMCDHSVYYPNIPGSQLAVIDAQPLCQDLTISLVPCIDHSDLALSCPTGNAWGVANKAFGACCSLDGDCMRVYNTLKTADQMCTECSTLGGRLCYPEEISECCTHNGNGGNLDTSNDFIIAVRAPPPSDPPSPSPPLSDPPSPPLSDLAD